MTVKSLRIAALIAPVFSALLPLAAAAQTPRDSARADSAQRLRAVKVTEARAVGTVGGASAVVVSPDQLRASPAPLLEQALRESPFVHVRQNSRGEMELSIRGSDSRQAAVLLDGVPITLGWDHRADPSLIPVTGAQSLVIVRGLGSLLNGPNTLGGTIEVSHENAFGRLGTNGAWGGVGVDEHAAYVASLGANRKLADIGGGILAIRGGFSQRQRDGFTLPSGAKDSTAIGGLRTNSDLEEIDGFASIRWGTPMGRGVGVTITGFNAERGVPPEEHISAPRLWRYPYHTRALAAASANTGPVQTPFGWGSIDLGAGYNTGRVKIESYSNRQYTTVTATELGDERTATGRALLTHSLPKNAKLKAAFTMAGVSYTETLSPAAPAEYRQNIWSAGAELDMPVGSKTTLAGGIVFDKSSTPETGGRTSQEPMDNAGWRVGLTHDATSALLFHLSASQRSRFPALRELYSGALNRFAPNPELEPETLLGFEAGFTVDRGFGPIPDGTLQLNAFRHTLDDAVVRITLPAPDGRFQRINKDRIESSGVELLAGVVFGPNRDRAVTVTGDATVQKIRLFDKTVTGGPERHAENNPEKRAMIELGVPLPWMSRAYVNARFTGTQYCLNADTGNEDTLESQTESDLGVERRFDVRRARTLFQSLHALVAVDNVGNSLVFDQCGLPQPGRTLRVMFSLR